MLRYNSANVLQSAEQYRIQSRKDFILHNLNLRQVLLAGLVVGTGLFGMLVAADIGQKPANAFIFPVVVGLLAMVTSKLWMDPTMTPSAFLTSFRRWGRVFVYIGIFVLAIFGEILLSYVEKNVASTFTYCLAVVVEWKLICSNFYSPTIRKSE